MTERGSEDVLEMGAMDVMRIGRAKPAMAIQVQEHDAWWSKDVSEVRRKVGGVGTMPIGRCQMAAVVRNGYKWYIVAESVYEKQKRGSSPLD